MSRGKDLGLEEARNMCKLNRFAREHPSQADERLWPLMESVSKGFPEGVLKTARTISLAEGYRK